MNTAIQESMISQLERRADRIQQQTGKYPLGSYIQGIRDENALDPDNTVESSVRYADMALFQLEYLNGIEDTPSPEMIQYRRNMMETIDWRMIKAIERAGTGGQHLPDVLRAYQLSAGRR